MSTKTKTKSKSKPKRKPSAKRAKPKQKQSNGNGSRVAIPRFEKIAQLATVLVKSDGTKTGTTTRGPVSTNQVDMVATKLVGRKSVTTLLTKTYGFKSVSQARDYAGGKTKRGELPSGVSAVMNEQSQKLGNARQHKIAGRKLIAILVSLGK